MKTPQTNSKNLIHRQARYNWYAQLLVRMGCSLPDVEGSEYRARLKNEWVDSDELKSKKLTFSPDQVTWFDEIHISQICGTNQDETLVFAKDENGLYKENSILDRDEERNKRVSVTTLI